MIKIFAEQRLSDFLDERLNRLRQEVQNQDTNYLLNVNETSFIDYLVNRYQVELLVFYWDQISVSYCEKPIPAELFPPSFHVRPGKSYPGQVITYHLPFSGDKELLKCQPSRYIMWTKDIRLEGDCVCFDVALLQTSFLIDLNERKTSNSKNWFSPPPLTITWML